MSRKDFLLNEALEVKRHLFQFLRQPTIEMKQIPDWHWGRLIGLQIFIAGITGMLARLVEGKTTFAVLAGMILSPILTLITIAVSTLFFYYCFQIFAKKTVSVRKLFAVVLFSGIPWFIFQILSSYLPPITPVALAFASLLLLIGFVENFQIDKKIAIKIILILYGTIFVLWIWGQISSGERWEKNWNSERIEAPEVELGK